MKQINDIILQAASGNHPACKSCPRNPKKYNTSFAVSCNEHFGTTKHGLLIIARDPGASDGGSSHTSKLCVVCNSDRSANRLSANLSTLKISPKTIYFLNAIMHGFFDENSKHKNETERNSCKAVIEEIITILQPKAILALGMEALRSSLEILLRTPVKKPTMEDMIEKSFSFGSISGVSVFAMPHPAFINTNLAKYKLTNDEVWGEISRNLNKLLSV
ncbi:MAG: hypothetical protein H8E76_00085 [Helicobacteraceae bacterium]|nr:hypothetical protein [Candidatus Sulfurimonas ponti]